MPKVSQGRLDGVYGMETFTVEELYGIADSIESQLTDPKNTDDPKWLKRRIDRVRSLARRKEKSREQRGREKFKSTTKRPTEPPDVGSVT